MEPLTALSLFCNIVDICDHAIKSALDSLEARLRSLDKGVFEVPGIVRNAKDISEEVRTKLCALSILGRLGDTNQRFWDVTEADSHTFNWILRDEGESSLSSHDGEQEPNRGGEQAESALEKTENLGYESTQRDVNVQLRNWLLDGSGLFHVSGKPGSGKSTLMKYLIKHPKVIDSLEQWAHPKRLALGRFFFWKPDHGQNSLDALIRGLLYSVIHYDAGLVHSAFPKCSGNSFEQLSLQSRVEMTKEDIFEAFNNLVKHGNVSKMFKFCFFIDGLDELDEEKDTTHSKMITILRQWADGANGSIKICVSSRHFPVFENMVADHRIRLQDLTKYDIIDFVQNSLRSDHVFRTEMTVNTQDCQKLINSIVERADGVFLWVGLVVKAVERGLSNDDPISVLHERVKSTPLRLEELFRSLLDSIEDCHAQMAVLLLAIALVRLADSGDSLVISLSGCRQFFRAMETSKPVSIDDTFDFDNSPETFELTPQMVKSTKSKLLFRCKGLLEIVPCRLGDLSDMDKYVGGRVTFLHRSISEFLKIWIPEHMNALGISSLQVKNATCWMLWAEVDFLNSTIQLQNFPAKDQLSARFRIRVMTCAIMANLGTDTTFTPELSSEFKLLGRADDALLMPAVSCSSEDQTKKNGKGAGCTWNTMSIDATETDSTISLPICPSYAGPLLAAAETRCYGYVRWKMAKTPPSAERTDYFQHCLEIAFHPLAPFAPYISGWVEYCMRMVEPLIQTSSADINGTLGGCCGMLSWSIKEAGAPMSVFDTIWIIALSHPSFIDAPFQQEFFHLIESLLGLGAMPQSVLCLGTWRDWFTVSPAPLDGPIDIQSDSTLQIPGSGLRNWSGELSLEHLQMTCGQDDGFITLEMLVAHAKPPNMAAILSLIERNSHNEDVKSVGARDLTSTERLHAAVLEKHGVRGNCKLVWFENLKGRNGDRPV
ncbi:hypothetical protein INS49_004984 [Diaporthe citri]|uniref:uncharacterized protein n=1 Tax=Diaporthe citri TaxID=83186 RepID=UPI001C7E62E5|nr:uncharacterized protein INS49_004984 [Diaporthe citri]KAG6354013.1 hypothetical protein INS49_004984 [Diaporthe citri]